MPFTLAHAAIIYPLKKMDRRLSVSGLITGAVIPDFEYFIRMRHISSGHQWNEKLLLHFTAALLLCFLFHGLIKKPLYENLPPKLSGYLYPVIQLNWNKNFLKHTGLITLSVLLGIFSHFLWDSFTHKGALMTELLPRLQYTFSIGKTQLPVYFMLQLLSSIGGLWILFRSVPPNPVVTEKIVPTGKSSFYWPGLILISLSLFLLRFFAWADNNSYLSLLKAAIGAVLYSWIIVSLLYRLIKKG